MYNHTQLGFSFVHARIYIGESPKTMRIRNEKAQKTATKVTVVRQSTRGCSCSHASHERDLDLTIPGDVPLQFPSYRESVLLKVNILQQSA